MSPWGEVHVGHCQFLRNTSVVSIKMNLSVKVHRTADLNQI